MTGLDKVLGSLTLGGYDLSRAGNRNISFPFAADDSRELSLSLLSITANIPGDAANHSLLPEAIHTFIDSIVPQIWLPVAACQQFEQLFGLVFDLETGLYLVKERLHHKLLTQNFSISFKLGDGSQIQDLEIVFPYGSFDLWVDYPLVQNRTRYFPIARAENHTQYTLRRVFLQEAYVPSLFFPRCFVSLISLKCVLEGVETRGKNTCVILSLTQICLWKLLFDGRLRAFNFLSLTNAFHTQLDAAHHFHPFH